MKKYRLHMIGILMLTYMLAIVVHAEEEKKEASFPRGVAVSKLTPEQEKEAQKTLDEAVQVYNSILDDKNDGKREYLQSNLEFVSLRTDKMQKELQHRKKTLASLNKEVMDKQKAIGNLPISAEGKAKKKIQLIDEFDERKEVLSFRITMIERHLGNLDKKEKTLKAEMIDLAILPEGNAISAAEKAEMRLNDHKKEQQLARFKKYE